MVTTHHWLPINLAKGTTNNLPTLSPPPFRIRSHHQSQKSFPKFLVVVRWLVFNLCQNQPLKRSVGGWLSALLEWSMACNQCHLFLRLLHWTHMANFCIERETNKILTLKTEKRSFGNQPVLLALQRFAHPKNIVLVAFFWVHRWLSIISLFSSFEPKTETWKQKWSV